METASVGLRSSAPVFNGSPRPLSTTFLSFRFIQSKKLRRFPHDLSCTSRPSAKSQKSQGGDRNFRSNLLKAQSVSARFVNGGWNGNYIQSGSFGIALISITATVKHRISPFVATLATNPTFVSGLFAWFFSQSTKVLLNFFVERKWDLKIMFGCGGMPSSHSALCTALTTSVALCHGVADSLFPVCLGFSLIVMYDAIGVRRHTGMQAEVLNLILEDLFEGHPIRKRKLKELLGHTPLQVLAGALLGIVVAWLCCQGSIIPPSPS
ncbi:yuiD, partial [Cucurbita argyrosperma subsp. argyrosperma]